MDCWHHRPDRRAFLGVLGVGLAAVITGCTPRSNALGPSSVPLPPQLPSIPPLPPQLPDPGDSPGMSAEPSPSPSGEPDLPPTPTDPNAWKGVLRHGPPGTQRIALTIDDGYCVDCVTGYVDFAQRTGIHLTFSPNGIYHDAWAPHATVLRPLIEAGQVQIMNHTFSHPRLTRCSTARVQRELERNEEWIAKTFATSARPYYRPPFGTHNSRVDALAADLGFDRVVLWDGSFSDSTLITPEFLMGQARKYLEPGVIMLGHANHPTVLGLFDQITQLIANRQLEPVTLHEMFGTTAEAPAPTSTPSPTPTRTPSAPPSPTETAIPV